jgi:hypothetical protein
VGKEGVNTETEKSFICRTFAAHASLLSRLLAAEGRTRVARGFGPPPGQVKVKA